jgi:hypothetical protein
MTDSQLLMDISKVLLYMYNYLFLVHRGHVLINICRCSLLTFLTSLEINKLILTKAATKYPLVKLIQVCLNIVQGTGLCHPPR